MAVKISRRALIAAAGLSAASGCRNGSTHPGGVSSVPRGNASVPKSAVPPLSAADVEIVTRQSPRYEALRQGYNLRIARHPAEIAVCKTTRGVAQAVEYAAARGWKVSLQSGGHSFEGYSSCDDGLKIHLGGMRSIVPRNDGTIAVGPGCTLNHLYAHLLPQGKLIPAGTCGTVGIGGLALGGGYGFFSRALGLTCDSLVDLTFVTGTGEVLQGSAHPELLWGCRGGGTGGLGAVTEMIFKTHAAPVYLHSWRWKQHATTGAQAAMSLKRWFSGTMDLPASCFSAFVLNGHTITILVTSSEAPKSPLISQLAQVGKGMRQVTTGKPQPLASALRAYRGSQSPLRFKNGSGGFYNGYSNIEACAEAILGTVMEAPGLLYQVNTLGGAINNEAAHSASCYPHRSKSYVAEIQAYWDRGALPQAAASAYRAIMRGLTEAGIDSHYVNYACEEISDWSRAYYGSSYERLKRLKAAMDPEDLFHFAQSIALH
jgi:FAD/FMN-containing dehydrogenase